MQSICSDVRIALDILRANVVPSEPIPVNQSTVRFNSTASDSIDMLASSAPHPRDTESTGVPQRRRASDRSQDLVSGQVPAMRVLGDFHAAPSTNNKTTTNINNNNIDNNFLCSTISSHATRMEALRAPTATALAAWRRRRLRDRRQSDLGKRVWNAIPDCWSCDSSGCPPQRRAANEYRRPSLGDPCVVRRVIDIDTCRPAR